MARFEINFPCGLRVKQFYYAWYFGDIEWRILYDKGCPIHGKDCRKNDEIIENYIYDTQTKGRIK